MGRQRQRRGIEFSRHVDHPIKQTRSVAGYTENIQRIAVGVEQPALEEGIVISLVGFDVGITE